jgi:thymidine phosphorylase
VKFGNAAFMRTPQEARELAAGMVTLARKCGMKTRALLTAMDTPLGLAAGNWLEVREVMDCLAGRAPTDLEQIVVDCAAHLLELAGKADSFDHARSETLACMNSLLPKRKFEEMIAAQGADLDAFHKKLNEDTPAPVVQELRATRDGYVTRCDARVIGEVVHFLGGGRTSRTDSIHPDVGVDALMKPGYAVGRGLTLARVHAEDEASAEVALKQLESAFTIGAEPPNLPPLILETMR